MDTLLSYGIAYLAACALFPVAVFLHELGHAIPPIAAGGRAHVMVGNSEGWTAETGPVRITIGAERTWSPLTAGYCRWEDVSSRAVRAAAHVGGPVLTILVLGAVTVAIATVRGDALRFGLYALFWYLAVQAVLTSVPMRYPSWLQGPFSNETSDGYKLLEEFRG